VLAVAAQNGKTVASSAKGTLSAITEKGVISGRLHDGQVRCLGWYGDYVVSGGDDYKIKFWEIE
jgi:WD40 repeat protein